MKTTLIKLIPLATALLIMIFISSCSIMHSIGKTMGTIKTAQDSLFDDIRIIATDEEEDEFYDLKSQKEMNDFMNRFWEKRDPTPGTEFNEMKDIYFKRKAIADIKFHGIFKGSLTDRGRVLILYGEPDFIEYYSTGDMDLGNSKIQGLEIWLYNEMTTNAESHNIFSQVHTGRVKFVFADFYGFGLYTQIYSSEKNEKIDCRVFLNNHYNTDENFKSYLDDKFLVE